MDKSIQGVKVAQLKEMSKAKGLKVRKQMTGCCIQ
jgi:hypothetical protein